MQTWIVALICAWIGFSTAAQAQTQPAIRTITVYGESFKEIVPNEAGVQITVVAKNRDVKVAKADHDKKLKKLFEIAGELQIERKDIKTLYAAVQPQYRYTNNEQVFEGYEVSTMLDVTVADVEKVGMFMQQLVDNKFEQIGNVQYRIDNDLAYRDAVLIEALDNAKEKAEKLAERAGGTLGNVVNITQGYAQPEQPQPMFHGRMMAMEAKAADMGGVAPPSGVMRINGTVTVMYELK